MDRIRRRCSLRKHRRSFRVGATPPAYDLELVSRTAPETDVADIPTADWSWINAAADRFERACTQGRRPRIEDYLVDVRPERLVAILDELLRVECELRRRGGEEPTAQEYHVRFPDYASVVDAVFREDLPEPADAEIDDPPREDPSFARPLERSEESKPFLSTAADELAPCEPH